MSAGSKFYVASGRGTPVFLVDETGETAAFDRLEDARESAQATPMCMALGYVILEWNEAGFVEAH